MKNLYLDSWIGPIVGQGTESIYMSRMVKAAGLAMVKINYSFTSMVLDGKIHTKFLR